MTPYVELVAPSFCQHLGQHGDISHTQVQTLTGQGMNPVRCVTHQYHALAYIDLCMGSDEWKKPVERNQDEMVEEMGLWGVPCYKLSGPSGEPDLAVWGQDRLWLVAAEIRRRAVLT